MPIDVQEKAVGFRIYRHLLAGKYAKYVLGQIGLDLGICCIAGLHLWVLVQLILITIIVTALEIQTDFISLSNYENKYRTKSFKVFIQTHEKMLKR